MYDDRSSDRHARRHLPPDDQPRRPVALNEAARVGELLDRERFERRVEAALHATGAGHAAEARQLSPALSIVALRLLAEGEPAADEGLLQGCAARLALALRAGDAIGRGDERRSSRDRCALRPVASRCASCSASPAARTLTRQPPKS
jgi:hypothetical protein